MRRKKIYCIEKLLLQTQTLLLGSYNERLLTAQSLSTSFEDILEPFLLFFDFAFSVFTNDLSVPTLSSLCF
jgi:hypothetical protein